MKTLKDGLLDRWTDAQICDARYQMSELMLEENGITGEPTDNARAAMVALDALNLALWYKRA